jgi:hypothetical protein
MIGIPFSLGDRHQLCGDQSMACSPLLQYGLTLVFEVVKHLFLLNKKHNILLQNVNALMEEPHEI